MNNLQSAVINIAGTQLGVHEATGHNDGPAVESYLASVGLGKGYAWCMAFIYWCFSRACKQLSLTNPLFKTGGVAAEWNSSNGLRITKPVPGCVGFIIHADGTGHAVLVTGAWPAKNLVHTIEGNSNNTGSREGLEVCRNLNRKIDSFVGFKIYREIPLT